MLVQYIHGIFMSSQTLRGVLSFFSWWRAPPLSPCLVNDEQSLLTLWYHISRGHVSRFPVFAFASACYPSPFSLSLSTCLCLLGRRRHANAHVSSHVSGDFLIWFFPGGRLWCVHGSVIYAFSPGPYGHCVFGWACFLISFSLFVCQIPLRRHVLRL